MRKRALLPLLACLAMVALPAELAGGQRRAPAVKLIAAMSGDEEPGGGDTDGYGAANITVSGTRRRICWHVAARQIDDVVGGHIHRGARGENGDIVVPLFNQADLDPSARGCERVRRSLGREIARFPSRFYVNVHTTPFPGGAIRGQLSR
jgi:CHRD domain